MKSYKKKQGENLAFLLGMQNNSKRILRCNRSISVNDTFHVIESFEYIRSKKRYS